jgi:predicted aspartyl protease
MRGTLESIVGWFGHGTRNARTGALAMLVLAAAFPTAATERLVIPFNMTPSGHMVVPLRINGSAEAVGVIDTAATYAMIDGATASAAGVPPPDELSVNVLGLEGPQIFPVVHVDSLSTGNTRIEAFPAALSRRIAVAGIHNVVPLTALEGDVVDFDFDEGRVLVYDGRPDRSTGLSSSRMRMHFRQGLWFAEVKMNGVKGLALIDTGSSISYVNSRFAEAAGAKPNDEKTQTIRGITGGNVAIRVATARKFTLGNHRVTGPDLVVADPALFTHLGMADEPAMVLGLDYLSIFRVQLDRRRGYLVLGIVGSRSGMGSVQMNAAGTHIRTD